MRAARRLALGRLISLTGGGAAYIALIAAVYDETGSAGWVSAALFAGVIGTVVAAPFSGWLGDHYDRRRVLIATDLASAIVSLAMSLTGQHEALVVLFAISALMQSPFEPASAAAMPNLAGTADLARANALVATTGSAGYLVGPLLGGVVLGAGASPSTLFAIDAATFVVSALIIASLRSPFGRGATDTHPGVLAGARVILRTPSLRLLVGAGMASLVGIGIVHVASYPLSIELGGGTEGYGAMTALVGGGGVLGAALAGRVVAAGPERVLLAAFVAGAAGLAVAGAAPVLVVALAGLAVAGAGGAWATSRRRRSCSEMRTMRSAAASSPPRTGQRTSPTPWRRSPAASSSSWRAAAVPSPVRQPAPASQRWSPRAFPQRFPQRKSLWKRPRTPRSRRRARPCARTAARP